MGGVRDWPLGADAGQVALWTRDACPVGPKIFLIFGGDAVLDIAQLKAIAGRGAEKLPDLATTWRQWRPLFG